MIMKTLVMLTGLAICCCLLSGCTHGRSGSMTNTASKPSVTPVGGRKPVAVEKAAAGVVAVRIGFHFGSRPSK